MYNLFEYGRMLSHRTRVAGFAAAIRESGVADAVVCEIGTGFGYFAVLAARMGARRVYAIECSDAIGAGPAFAEENGVADKVVFLRGLSTELELPERAGVLISDLRASTPFHGAHLASILDARRRFLSPGGRMVPLEDRLYVAILRSERVWRRVVEPWRDAVEGVSMELIRGLAAQRPTRLTIPSLELCPQPQSWGTLDYGSISGPDFSGGASFEIGESGTGYGFCLWFDSRLSPGVLISGAPGQPPLPYGQYLLPFTRPVELVAGDRAEIAIGVEWDGEAGNRWRWSFARRSGAGGLLADRIEGRSDPDGAAERALQGSLEKR